MLGHGSGTALIRPCWRLYSGGSSEARGHEFVDQALHVAHLPPYPGLESYKKASGDSPCEDMMQPGFVDGRMALMDGTRLWSFISGARACIHG